MESLANGNSFKLSDIMDLGEYERLRVSKEKFIKHNRNEDTLYGVYVPREQKLNEKGEFSPSSGAIEFELLPDVVCVNMDKMDGVDGIEKFESDITVLDGKALRSGQIRVLTGKPLDPRYNGLKFLRLSAGTIDIVESVNSKGEKHIHIPTVHRGRTGYDQNWDQRTTTAGGALTSDLASDSLREAVEESGIIGINKDGKYELCLPEMEGVDSETITGWMDAAIDAFLSPGGKFERFIAKGGSKKWNPKEIEASEYAKKVFGRNFHGSKKGFSPGQLKTILKNIKKGKRYSFRKSRNMTRSDQIIQDVGEENYRDIIVHDGNTSKRGSFWIDNDLSTHFFHAFRIQTDISYPEGFEPIFRFYSESGVHYQRNPRIENLTGDIDTTGLKVPSSIDMKPVPFLQKFARQVVEGRTRRKAYETLQ